MLPTETVSAPVSGQPIWLAEIKLIVLQIHGKRWRDTIIKIIAADLYEGGLDQELVVWFLEVDGDPRPLQIYVSYTCESAAMMAVLKRIARELNYEEEAVAASLPPGAVPVLKRRSDGTLVRLRPEAEAAVPERQRIAVDWTRLTLRNALYAIEHP